MYQQPNNNKQEANKVALLRVPTYVYSVHQQRVSSCIYQLFPKCKLSDLIEKSYPTVSNKSAVGCSQIQSTANLAL